MTARDPSLPLDDLRVIDLTVARAGPTCTRQLADWGADVVHVEVPARATDAAAGMLGLRSTADFQNLHRNKRSLTLDLKTEEGRGLLLRLVDTADVVVENLRPPVKARLGFDYDTLRARNPRIVLASISGFGQDGPYASRGGVDQIAQGMGGLMSVTGLPGSPPTRAGIAVSDLAAGIYLSFGILVALHERARTGVGQWVRTSLLEAMVGMMDFQVTRASVDGVVPVQEGNHHPVVIPMGCFETADGYVNVAGAGARLYSRLLDVLGIPELADDPRFDTTQHRSEHRDELNEIVANHLRTHDTADWVDAFTAAGVPCGPVYRVDEMLADPQVEHLGLIQPVESDELGTLPLVRNPVTSSTGVITVRTATPALGAHTDEILRELGLDQDAIDDLRAREIV